MKWESDPQIEVLESAEVAIAQGAVAKPIAPATLQEETKTIPTLEEEIRNRIANQTEEEIEVTQEETEQWLSEENLQAIATKINCIGLVVSH